MPQARVYNDNVHPYNEVFKGSPIHIPANGYIDMDYEDALQFEYTGAPMIKNAGGQQCPTSFKRIRVVPMGAVPLAEVPLVCHATGEKAATPAQLRELEQQNAHLLHDEAKEQVKELAEKDVEIAALKAQLAAAQAPAKRGPGRPRSAVAKEA